MAGNFSSIPVLDYTLLSTGRKDEFISQLRHALINVGFLYLLHPPVDKALIDDLIAYAPRLFELPQEKKDAIRMANSPHFLGYSRLGAELTKGATDQREQYDLATDFESPWKPGDPEYLRLCGPGQEERDLPGFKATMLRYLEQVETLSYELIALIAEALGLARTGLAAFFAGPPAIQHRAKVVNASASAQGVGPHFDAGFLTLLLQASPRGAGLQVQNRAGAWVAAPPVRDTFVAATRGLARATPHRVRSPPAAAPPRYSIPFFQRIAQGVRLTEHYAAVPVNYAEYALEPSGKVELIGRVKSHPDVAERHYPDLFKQFFPDGLPAQGKAY
ncbi:hypothetical protein DFH11DRAFT_1685995 [Phellopilus nigrolimitatus]|nr:hypothetical protein DFH11DRAFT_1685995 [Phellopilus nigrolimitatus]